MLKGFATGRKGFDFCELALETEGGCMLINGGGLKVGTECSAFRPGKREISVKRLKRDDCEKKRSQITYHLGRIDFEIERDCQMWARHSRSHQHHGH